jgi:O-antigen/teichoic acid export membrane protein
VRARRFGKPSARPRRSAVRSGILTGVSALVLSGSGAAAAAILAQKFGRDAATDGFLAAYGVYLVLTLVAQALRLTAVPELTRSDGAAAGSFAAAVLVVGVPATLLTWTLAEPIGEALTGGLPNRAAALAAEALPWLVPAAFLHVLAALTAATLAVRDRYEAAAVGYSAGGILTLVLFVLLADEHGLVALAWGLIAGASVSLAISLAALATRLPRLEVRRVGRRLVLVFEAAAVPIALQVVYVVCLRLAAGLEVGAVTSFSYAYFFAAILVAATATSLSVVSTAELTRRGIDAAEAAAHVVHGAWLSLAVIAPAAGVFALAGDRIAGSVLGDAFSGDVGTELARLVVVLAPWTLASVGFSLAFPLLYVVERHRVLVPIALGAIVVHVPIAIGLRELWGIEGLALALGITVLGVLAALLLALSPHALADAVRALARVAVSVALIVGVSFGLAALVLSDATAALAGLAAYAALLALVRPRGLREAWAYLRELH